MKAKLLPTSILEGELKLAIAELEALGARNIRYYPFRKYEIEFEGDVDLEKLTYIQQVDDEPTAIYRLIYRYYPLFGRWDQWLGWDLIPTKIKTPPSLARCMINLAMKGGHGVILDPFCGCYDVETEVLTKDGWKRYNEITYDDYICTLNPKTNHIEYHKPIRIIRYHYRGKMYRVKTSKVDLLVTPDHNMDSIRFSRKRD